jgi:hypothetical protein
LDVVCVAGLLEGHGGVEAVAVGEGDGGHGVFGGEGCELVGAGEGRAEGEGGAVVEGAEQGRGSYCITNG